MSMPVIVKSLLSVTERNAFDELMTKSTMLIETIPENNRKECSIMMFLNYPDL